MLLFEGTRISYRELPKSATGKFLNGAFDLGSLRERLPRRPESALSPGSNTRVVDR